MGKISNAKFGKVSLKAWILLLPSLIFLTMFTIYPVIRTIYMSFFRISLGHEQPLFIGFDNYKQLIEDEIFLKVMENSFLFSLRTIPSSIFLGLIMAIILNRKTGGIGFLRTAFFYPTVIPMIAIANIWLFIYTPRIGILDQVFTFLHLPSMSFLGNKNTVLWALSIMYVWREAGYLMVFYLSGLQNISTELYEAARLDGASPVKIFTSITVPLLMPTTLFVSTIALTNSFKTIDHIIVMTQGMPDNASNLLLYYIYQQGFQFWNQGKAATLTVVMLGIMLAIAAVQFFKSDSKIHYS